ncbi:hypothetical protein PIB30_074999 [Stylosanthes scabra]|uniref:Uncharacterized protein n=1 Tax=Stylosanthes scabra TaxID=79078 RepID=A0ABU6XRN8_9FABA|nr:hypothetical protein [Stylosanthes scabra]
MREAQKRTETQLTNPTELLTKFTNQEKNGKDKERADDEWLLELISELAKLNESDEEEESDEKEEEEEKESEEEDVDEEDGKRNILHSHSVWGNKAVKNEIPAKCADHQDHVW